MRKVLQAAGSGADAVHPGYGFLAESAKFAQAVLNAGLTWIGPPPSAIRRLGDKLSARQAARQAGAPLLPAMSVPASNAAQVAAFAGEHGLPVVVKAAAGGGGKGVAFAWSAAEIPGACARAMHASAAAGGWAECFAERYLDHARHVEVPCLADSHGGVAVISTRDCSLQRRHQKIVEEAPAPFLPAVLDRHLRAASAAILRAAGCAGAATCEFLLGRDGTLAFLEANARLAVAHPVREEVTGLHLARRALHEFEITGLATSLPLHRALITDEAFAPPDPARPFSVHTGWTGSNWPVSASPGA